MFTQPIALLLLPDDILKTIQNVLMKHHIFKLGTRRPQFNKCFKITARLGEWNCNARSARALSSRRINRCAKLLSSSSVPLACFRGGNLKNDRVKLLVVPFGAAPQKSQNLLRVRHRRAFID